ncbi:MAG: MBL fold metallo-hydrolase [Clostridiales bacterium]|nr:MBL fold metallo-hydrolase [Clostridiales bacterium]PWM40286.1 MAG: MBL fold metallo-hydrolase [Clostridiales bacterium]
MAKGKRYRGRARRSQPLWLLAAAVVAAAALWGARTLGILPDASGEKTGAPVSAAQGDTGGGGSASGTLEVYFFDVGQGDSELIRLPGGENILIDAGTSSTEDELVGELRSLGAETLDLVVATHPHADHIGGMAAVIDAFDVRQVVMPRISESDTPTTKTYENLLQSIADKGLTITPAEPGDELLSSGGAVLTVLAPNGEDYGDLNNYSVVLRLTYGEDSFLFTGDAEEASEEEMLSLDWPLTATVLKCGHHGSETSTSPAFLDAVSPQYAVISCGVDNDYGHPDAVTLEKLEAAGAEVFRTDLQGTILASTDGSGVTMTALGKAEE